ncbi:MAG: PAS domain-containing protein [Flavobacteriales bacterium]|nr:PAS domain-containing protein [Flavobacteriales bacterium]
MITDLKKLEERFFQIKSRAEADEFIASCGAENAMVSTHDPNGIYNAVSKTCETLIGYKPKDLIGNSPYDYFHPDDFQTILKSHAKVTVRPDIDMVDYRLKMPNGKFKEVTSFSRQVKDPSGLEFILVLTFERS